MCFDTQGISKSSSDTFLNAIIYFNIIFPFLFFKSIDSRERNLFNSFFLFVNVYYKENKTKDIEY